MESSVAFFLGTVLSITLARARALHRRAALANTPVWAEGDTAWKPLPPLEHEERCDVCVIGLGGSGLVAVQSLIAAGVDVVGVDAVDAGAGAAGRNGGLLLAGSPAFYHDAVRNQGRDRAKALYAATLAELDYMFANLPSRIARRTGSLRIAADAAELADCAALAVAMRADGFPVEEYSGPEGEGLLFPMDGVMQPLARVRELAHRARAGGARLYGNSPVLRIHGTRVVTSGGSVIIARRVIVAVDGRLESLLPELRGRVRTARLQMAASSPLPPRARGLPRPLYTRWGYEYAQQLPDGRIAAGGFRDTEVEAEWTHEAHPTPGIQRRISEFLTQLHAPSPITAAWAASVSYTPEDGPDAGAHISEEVRPGVWAIGAYCGTGNVIGAIAGKEAAAWAVRTLPPPSATPVSGRWVATG